MAITRMRKLRLLAHSSSNDQVIHLLRRMGTVHLSDLNSELEVEVADEALYEVEKKIADTETQLAHCQYVLEFLNRFYEKPGALQAMLNPKLMVSEDQLDRVINGFDLDGVYARCQDLDNRIGETKREMDKGRALTAELSHWESLDLPLEEVRDTARTCISLAIAELSTLPAMKSEVETIADEIHVGVTDQSRQLAYLILFFLKEHEVSITAALKKYNCRLVRFADISGTPAQNISRVRTEIQGLQEQVARLEEEAKALVTCRDEVLILHDHLSEVLEAKRTEVGFAHTVKTFIIEGWLKKDDEDKLRRRLEAISKEIHLTFEDPGEEDDVPIAFENRSLVSPFELITSLYGQPAYTEYDPTLFLAPFFIVSFALCLTDAGYGAALAIISFIAMKKLKMGESAAKLLKVLFYGGIVTIIAGLMTRGLFGIDEASLPGFLRAIPGFNPMNDPITMLYIVLFFGFLQIMTGIAIKMAESIKKRKWAEALLDQGLWLILLPFLMPLAYSGIFGEEVSEGTLSFATKGALVLLVAIVLTQGRSQKKIYLRPLVGLTKLYDVVGYFGDVLSYSRLLALGLATAAIAVAVNAIAGLVLEMPFYLGYILAPFVILAGHTMNIAINALGGFVHSMRLQYVEFFQKFFIPTGVEFRPFREDRKFTALSDQ